MQDKNKIGKCFAASVCSYDKNALVQKEVAERLTNLILPQMKADRVLEIGCGTGIFTERFTQKVKVQTLYINDLASELCECAARRAAATKTYTLVGDGERIDLPDDLDLIVSASCLQWFDDLSGFFPRMQQKLNSTGQLVVAFYGEGTMYELTKITGQGLRYLSRVDVEKIVAQNFSSYKVQNYTKTLYFPSIFSILKHVRNTGVGAISASERKNIKLCDFEEQYRKEYGGQQGLPLTYNCYLLTAQK